MGMHQYNGFVTKRQTSRAHRGDDLSLYEDYLRIVLVLRIITADLVPIFMLFTPESKEGHPGR